MGKKISNLRVDRYNIKDVLDIILSHVPSLKTMRERYIYEIDFKTRKRKLCKKILIVNELFLKKQEIIPIIF
ncbi:MAG: hypothetical protein ACTSRI_19555 [Promethearchaeota archaeon]